MSTLARCGRMRHMTSRRGYSEMSTCSATCSGWTSNSPWPNIRLEAFRSTYSGVTSPTAVPSLSRIKWSSPITRTWAKSSPMLPGPIPKRSCGSIPAQCEKTNAALAEELHPRALSGRLGVRFGPVNRGPPAWRWRCLTAGAFLLLRSAQVPNLTALIVAVPTEVAVFAPKRFVLFPQLFVFVPQIFVVVDVLVEFLGDLPPPGRFSGRR